MVKGTPLFEALPESTTQFDPSLGQLVYTAGSNFVAHVLLGGNGFSVPPSGSVTVNLASPTVAISQTVTLNPNEYLNENLANAFVIFPAVPAGTYTLNTTYAGDSNWSPGTFTYGQKAVDEVARAALAGQLTRAWLQWRLIAIDAALEPSPNSDKRPTGTYAVTVTAVSGGIKHATAIHLQVQ